MSTIKLFQGEFFVKLLTSGYLQLIFRLDKDKDKRISQDEFTSRQVKRILEKVDDLQEVQFNVL